ncbi:hypothetical protein Glove_772g16 [Diversispora epigaea]|uniref:Uncharacterized protein n=1 Tax=Diversispora epigaea TaxID=1348612 RepID=A0A397FZ33_9GLOM|nr:hypothetical protein Glove_772g16 [Diversispora epigaea]
MKNYKETLPIDKIDVLINNLRASIAPIDPAPKHIHIDLREAYLGCEDSERSESEVLSWVRRYRFSERTQRCACVKNIEAVHCLTGIVQLRASIAPIDPAPKHIHIDLREAYLGCEDSERSESEVLSWVRRYRFSERTQRCACVKNIEAVHCLTGIVQLVAWEFAKNLHPFTAGLIGQHLTEKESCATPREIIYSVGKKSHIEFPSDRDLAVRFVGSCARNAQYEGDKKRTQWLHIRSFILAYTHIAVLEQLKRFPIENVLRVCTDAIYTTAIPKTILDESKLRIDFDESLYTNAKNDIELEEVHKKYNAEINKIKKQYKSVIVLDTPEIKYGQWRKKKSGYIYCREASSWSINYKGSLEFPPSEVPPLSTDPKLITLRKPYLVGQGGSGKTTRAIRAFPNRKIVILTPANLLAEYHRKQNLGLIAMTYHKYFHLGGDKESPHKFLTEWADEVIWCMEDYHAQYDELKALKLRMWMKNDLAQLLEFRKAIPKITWENALA